MYHKYECIIKKHHKHIRDKLNEQQYIITEILFCCWFVNNGQLVWCSNPLLEERKIGSTAASSWDVTRRKPGVLSRRERETPYLMEERYRDNGNSGAAWLLWSFQAFILSFLPYLFHSEKVALRACPSQALESLCYQ